MKLGSPDSLKGRSLLVVAAIYLGVGLLTLGALALAARGILDGFGRRFAAEHVLLDKNRILAPVQRELVLARKLADSPVLRSWCRNEKDPVARRLALAELESYRRLFADGSYFFVVGESGNYYFNNAADEFRGRELRYTLRRDDPTMAWYFTTMTEVEEFALNVDSSEQLGVLKVWLNVVVKDEEGEKVGLGGTGLDLTRFVRDIVQSADEGVLTVLVDSRGTLQAHPNQDYIEHNARIKNPDLRLTLFQLLDGEEERVLLRDRLDRVMRDEASVETFYLNVEGRRYLAAATHMPEIDWVALTLLDPARVVGMGTFAPIPVILALSLLATLALVSALLNRLVLAPLARLTASAQEIEAGNYSVELPLDRSDEIGRLTAAFNHMTATVRSHTGQLEEKVRDRTRALTETNRQLTESNRKILDGLRYAQLVQGSVLPRRETLCRHLPDHFVLYRPRDLVGGDFYLFVPDPRGFLLGIADCTGHGVAGAFMAMSARAVLDRLLAQRGPDDPARLLGELNQVMKTSLGQAHRGDGAEPLDNGADLALVRVVPGESRLRFAGARLSLLVVPPHGEPSEVAGDRQSLGYRRSSADFRFHNRDLELRAECGYYLYTDGILDQGGGARGFGFGRRRLTTAVAGLRNLPMAAQGEALAEVLAEYQGSHPQRDDITVVGFRRSPEPLTE